MKDRKTYTWKHSGFPLPQLVKNPPVMQETPVWFLGQEDLLEKGKATHSRNVEEATAVLSCPVTHQPTMIQLLLPQSMELTLAKVSNDCSSVHRWTFPALPDSAPALLSRCLPYSIEQFWDVTTQALPFLVPLKYTDMKHLYPFSSFCEHPP